MESPILEHNGWSGYSTEQRESHWQPALRPDSDDSILQAAHTTKEAVSEPQSVSFHDRITVDSPPGFTHTIVETPTYELPSDDDDERLDPAWGIRRTDSTRILDSVHRSSSFPAFSIEDRGFSQPSAAVVPPQPSVLESQPQQLMNKIGGESLQNANEILDADEELLTDHDGFLQSTQSTDSQVRDSTSDRFQEGMPLINSLHQPTNSIVVTDEPLLANDAAEIVSTQNQDEEDETSFFSGLTSKPQQLEVPPSLERKSTSEVLESLQLPQSNVPDSPLQQTKEIPSTGFTREILSDAHVSNTLLAQDLFPDEIAADDLFPMTETNLGPVLDEPIIDSLKQTEAVDADLFLYKPLEDYRLVSGRSERDAFAEEVSAEELFGTFAPVESIQPEETDSKWAAALGDDEFLMEDDDDLLPDSEPGSPSSFIASLQGGEDLADTKVSDIGTNQSGQQIHSRNTSASYTPLQPSSDAAQLSPRAHTEVGLGRPGLAPMGSFQKQLQRPVITPRAESFADQTKGGYKSPYDLPIDLAKPKKRPQTQRVVSQAQKGMPPPPPRTSSMSSDRPLQPPFTPTTQTFGTTAAMPSFSPASGTRVASTPTLSVAKPNSKPSSSGFFEELPITARPRPASGTGRYTPSQSFGAPLAQLPPQSPPQQRTIVSQPQPAIPKTQDLASQFQLQPPERLDPYANVPIQTGLSASTTIPSRYSPVPPSSLGASRPSPSPRYSPAPPTQAPTAGHRYASQPATTQGPTPVAATTTKYASQAVSAPPIASSAVAFQPRTSSPLAFQQPLPMAQNNSMMPPQVPANVVAKSISSGPVSPPRNVLPPRPSAPPNPTVFSSPQKLDFAAQPNIVAPKRSQTQSPSQQAVPRPSFPMLSENTFNRPASAYGHVSPAKTTTKIESNPIQSSLRSSVMTQELEFVKPTDETQFDVLERWKGAPIFQFGFGGNILTSIPVRTPRYSSGLMRPLMKVSSGTVSVRQAKDVFPQTVSMTTFPGPLRGKSKKKDVLTWLTASIARFETEPPQFLGFTQTLPDPRKRHEEKTMLWKIVKTLVEHDGNLDNPDALKAINVILAPEIYAIDESTASQYDPNTEPAGIYRPAGTSLRSDSADPLAVEALRKHLLKGKREDAVWGAVDSRLWSHALLIASTLDRSVWKQVVQEFVRQEVKTVGNNTEALATVYEIFGGNVEESVDQLVPPSARAGLQMVSKADSNGPIKNALDGLDRWKETLTLILNNRTKEDQKGLITLARLLGDYGRLEAAHICYLFCRGPTFPNLFGGVDEQSAIVLLGADVRNGDIHLDEDAVLLTEVYEFATCTLGGGAMSVPLPHLASFKLQRAKQLADYGMKIEAQAYCDAIAANFGTKAKISPYYHPVFLGELDDLSNRLKQVPVQSSSWMTKPTVDKVTGSIFSKFTSFVAGDDSDAASQGSGKDGGADVGPFANVTGSPSLSRTGSQTDLYGGFPAMTPVASTTAANSRYAPNGLASARSSSEFVRGRPSLDSQRSPPTTSYGADARQSLYAPMMQNQSPARSVSAYQPLGTSPSNLGTSPSMGGFQPPPSQASYAPVVDQSQVTNAPVHRQDQLFMPVSYSEEEPAYMPSQPDPLVEPSSSNFMPDPQNGFQGQDVPSSDIQAPSGYEAPQSYGYEPPESTGYVPYEPDPESDNESTKPKSKKKSFMDDDRDDFKRSGQTSSQSAQPVTSNDDDSSSRRKAADDAANAAFLAAVAEDEKKAKAEEAAKKASGGWFGGWLGSKKQAPESLDSKPTKTGGKGGDSTKPVQVHLGENKMKLYYDEKLKKWVNPDNPDSMKPKAGPPPPPRIGGAGTPPVGLSGPPRSAGVSSAPPMSAGNISGRSTPASNFGDGPTGIATTLPPNVSANLGLQNGTPPPSAAGIPLPPSKAPTPVSGTRPVTASATGNIDDLLGPPSGVSRKAGAKGAKKKAGRYVDVMAQ